MTQNARKRVVRQVRHRVCREARYIGGTELEKVADLTRPTQTEQIAEIRGGFGGGEVIESYETWITGSGKQQGEFVFIGKEVPLDPVEGGLGKRQGCERSANLVTDRNGSMVLPFRGRRDHQTVEPRIEPRILEDSAAEFAGVLLFPVVDLPSPGYVIAIGIVELKPFQIDVYVPHVLFFGVVAVLPLPPAEFVEQLLRPVPLPMVGLHGPEFYGRADQFKAAFRASGLSPTRG